MAVGGHFDPQNNTYSQYSEIFDLSIDKWTRNAMIKFQRLQPFMVPIGVEKAVLIGGFKRKNRKFEDILVKQAEIIDSTVKASYLPKSNYKLPPDVKRVIGVFKIG